MAIVALKKEKAAKRKFVDMSVEELASYIGRKVSKYVHEEAVALAKMVKEPAFVAMRDKLTNYDAVMEANSDLQGELAAMKMRVSELETEKEEAETENEILEGTLAQATDNNTKLKTLLDQAESSPSSVNSDIVNLGVLSRLDTMIAIMRTVHVIGEDIVPPPMRVRINDPHIVITDDEDDDMLMHSDSDEDSARWREELDSEDATIQPEDGEDEDDNDEAFSPMGEDDEVEVDDDNDETEATNTEDNSVQELIAAVLPSLKDAIAAMGDSYDEQIVQAVRRGEFSKQHALRQMIGQAFTGDTEIAGTILDTPRARDAVYEALGL